MKKEKVVFILLTIFVIVSVVCSFNTYINQRDNTRLTDQVFITSLSEATTGFGVDYSELNENDKIFYYLKISSNLNTAMNIIDFTSYKNMKNRNKLFEAIYNLYWCMTRNDSRDAILSNEDRSTIFECLSNITRNPEDEKDCQIVSRIAGDLYFNRVK